MRCMNLFFFFFFFFKETKQNKTKTNIKSNQSSAIFCRVFINGVCMARCLYVWIHGRRHAQHHHLRHCDQGLLLGEPLGTSLCGAWRALVSTRFGDEKIWKDMKRRCRATPSCTRMKWPTTPCWTAALAMASSIVASRSWLTLGGFSKGKGLFNDV